MKWEIICYLQRVYCNVLQIVFLKNSFTEVLIETRLLGLNKLRKHEVKVKYFSSGQNSQAP